MSESLSLAGNGLKRRRIIKWCVAIGLTASLLSSAVVFAVVRIRESSRKLDVV